MTQTIKTTSDFNPRSSFYKPELKLPEGIKNLMAQRTGQRWTKEEEHVLLAAFEGGLNALEIALECERTVSAIAARLCDTHSLLASREPHERERDGGPRYIKVFFYADSSNLPKGKDYGETFAIV
tara:strand:+ start:30 stop:404 length:375 start_codon:yes stop_codon:yes gene_type:complete